MLSQGEKGIRAVNVQGDKGDEVVTALYSEMFLIVCVLSAQGEEGLKGEKGEYMEVPLTALNETFVLVSTRCF